jgi:hypothetical protein
MNFDTSTHLTKRLHVSLVLVCAVIYFFAFQLNDFLFGDLQFSAGVNWVFIPSGLRLLLVLVLSQLGAIGIALASCAISYLHGSPDSHLFNLVTGVISGATPLIARYVALHTLKLNVDLSGLTGQNLFKASLLFALISAFTHQIWFVWQGATTDFIASALVMAIGDWLGTVLVLALASVMIKLYRQAFN